MIGITEPRAISDASVDHKAADVLLLPVAGLAMWTAAYQLVLLARWPAKTITWIFAGFALLALFLVRYFWNRSKSKSVIRYEFHLSHILLLAPAIGCTVLALFIHRPNQDDVVYFHRVLTQLTALGQPIFVRQTSVDIDAAPFSPVHLTTSHEMLMGLLAHYLRIDPLYFYQVVGHAAAAFLIPFVFYWCLRVFGLRRWPAFLGSVLAILFFLMDGTGRANFGNIAVGRMWQGKVTVWILFLPVALALSYRFLETGKRADIVWLTLLDIAAVGLSNTGLYLIPAVVGCSVISSLAVHLVNRQSGQILAHHFRRCLWLGLPLIYPIGILILLKVNIIPKPISIQGFGPKYIPWSEAVNYVVGWPVAAMAHLRNVVLMTAVPLLILRDKRGFFLFFYVCAVWLLCLNPLLAHRWMENILAANYFRLVYLLPIPLLFAMIPEAIRQSAGTAKVPTTQRLTNFFAVAAIAVSSLYAFRHSSIAPRNPLVGWKSPGDYQLLQPNIDFARAAGPYIKHSKFLAPCWAASCEIPLLFPQMKVVAPRLVRHYFDNANNPEEGALRRYAQVFVEGAKTNDPKEMAPARICFRKVIETGRANAIAAPESESKRVLAALKGIDSGWHKQLEAGGLVLLLPASGGSTSEK